MKISIITFDLSHNCLGRVYLLGKVLRRRYEVDIHGFTFSRRQPIWKPCDTGEFAYKAMKGGHFPLFLKSMLSMSRQITGDVIYASKLRLPSYGVALLKKHFSGKPVVLDIDDLETAGFNQQGLRLWKSALNPVGALHTKWMENFVEAADEITTVSSQLQTRFGRGIIIPHGRDTAYLDPAKYDRDRMRRELGIDRFKVIMFLGTARPHKGLDLIVQAMNLLGRDDLRLMIVGAGADPTYEKQLQASGGERVMLEGQIPFSAVPRFLSAADLVVLPQKKTKHTSGQIPAKIFDAMAMAKPIIASRVSGLPEILSGSGIVIEPENVRALASEIDWVISHPEEASVMGKRAREKCILEYSWDVMEKKMVQIFEKFT